jgi:hypothetical protein
LRIMRVTHVMFPQCFVAANVPEGHLYLRNDQLPMLP